MIASGFVSRKLAVIALILLILLLVIPLGIGMAMGSCPECPAPGATPHALSYCAAVLVALALMLSVLVVRIDPRSRTLPLLLLSHPLDRPPRSV